MGDIQTHAAIAAAVDDVLPRSEPRAAFELGNFLTDVSQFRDPFAHLSGKTRMWQLGRAEHPEGFIFAALDLVVGLDNYLDELMGVAGQGPREGAEGDPAGWRPDDGELAAWFRDVVLLYTTERFHRRGLAKDQILAVFDRRFTQYYPHEHMDFPPWPPGSALGGERGRHSQVDIADGSAKRLLLAYLDDQLEYVADLLTRVEKEWARVAATPDGLPDRRQQLAALGHASHALEDFFFHSNFVELGWAQLHPGDPAPTRPMPPPSVQELDSIGPAVSDVHRQRIYHRRRRAPLADPGDTALSTDESADATEVYTGQFGANDIFFTFVDAIGHLLLAEPAGARPGAFDLFRDALRKVLFGTPEEQATELANHHRRLVTHEYTRLARAAALVGTLEPFEVEAIERACERDLRLATRYGSIASGGTPLGILGMLQRLMNAAREAAKASAQAAVAIDADAPHSVADDRSDNGAASDAIGSHTLMAKDSVRKEPLRVEAVNLATVAATFVGRSMTERSAATPDDAAAGVDWAAVLRSFVGHPAQATGAPSPWWEAALESVDPALQAGHDVPTLARAAFDARAAEPHRRALEQLYEALSADAQDTYRTAVDRAFVLDSAQSAGMLGGLAGLVSGLVNGASAGDAGRAVGAGGLGLLAGGAAGLVGSLLVIGLATEADASAGAVTGAVTSWAASPVGAWFIGQAIADAL
jgi:hypothetical protein